MKRTNIVAYWMIVIMIMGVVQSLAHTGVQAADSLSDQRPFPATVTGEIPADVPHWYRARVVKVVDADTIDVIVELGFNTQAHERLRWYRINAWETRGEEREKGLAAKAWVAALIDGKMVWIHTVAGNSVDSDKKGKYGRWLADVWFEGKCLNDELVRLGYARYQAY